MASAQHKKNVTSAANVKIVGSPPAFEKAWLRIQMLLFMVTGLCYGLTASGALPPNVGFALTLGGALCMGLLGMLTSNLDTDVIFRFKLHQYGCMVALFGMVRICVRTCLRVCGG